MRIFDTVFNQFLKVFVNLCEFLKLFVSFCALLTLFLFTAEIAGPAEIGFVFSIGS